MISIFIDAMRAAGCGPANSNDIIASGKDEYYRLEGDKRDLKGGYCLTIEADGFAHGNFINFRTGDKGKWHSAMAKKDITPEERKAYAERQRAADRARAKAAAVAAEKAAAEAVRVWSAAQPATEHPYLAKKGISGEGARVLDGRLIIPIMDKTYAVVGYQEILADGTKLMQKDAKISGRFCALHGPDDRTDVFVLCEGWATGKTIKSALVNVPVWAAFNAGNLAAVAAVLAANHPNARIIVAADSDQWTPDNSARKKNFPNVDYKSLPGNAPEWDTWRRSGWLVNRGVIDARAAAALVGGVVAVAPIAGDDIDRRTDFNDVAAVEGLDAVRNAFLDLLPSSAVVGVGASALDVQSDDRDIPLPDDYNYEPDYESREAFEALPTGDFDLRFKVLGYNEGQYYYFPFKGRQIVSLTASGHSIQNLLQLEDLQSWRTIFGGGKISEKELALRATNAMIQLATARGVFQQEDRVRGAGAWMDKGRVVMHCGDALYVDGKMTAFDEVESEFTYVAARKLMRPAKKPLTNYEAVRLRKLCEALNWEDDLSGSLLAGWLVIAVVCSALDFRPHIYITGESDSGKSTVMDMIIKPVLGAISMNFDGGTTEPAIRDAMGYNGRPLIYDEAEPSPHMANVIELARKASSGSTVKKFGQRPFKARFSGCFAAINPPINKTADENRFSFMVLKKNTRPTAMQEYEDILKMIEETITPDFSEKLVTRILMNMDALQKNIKVFTNTARKVLNAARASKQIGTMLAGLYLLGRESVITEEDAVKWVREREWSNHTMIGRETDPMRMVQHIAGKLLKYTPASGSIQEISIGDLINMWVDEGDKRADKLLRYHAIAVYDGRVWIAGRSENLKAVFRGTEWESGWSRTLSDIVGAVKFKHCYFSAGVDTSGISLPLSLFLEKKKTPLTEAQFEGEGF